MYKKVKNQVIKANEVGYCHYIILISKMFY